LKERERGASVVLGQRLLQAAIIVLVTIYTLENADRKRAVAVVETPRLCF